MAPNRSPPTLSDTAVRPSTTIQIMSRAADGCRSDVPYEDVGCGQRWLEVHLAPERREVLENAFLRSTAVPGEGGSFSWTYSPAEADIDFLAAGERIARHETLTLSMQAESVSGPYTVTIAIAGTNDAPVGSAARRHRAVLHRADAGLRDAVLLQRHGECGRPDGRQLAGRERRLHAQHHERGRERPADRLGDSGAAGRRGRRILRADGGRSSAGVHGSGRG